MAEHERCDKKRAPSNEGFLLELSIAFSQVPGEPLTFLAIDPNSA